MRDVIRGRTVAAPLNPLNASIVTDGGGLRLKLRPVTLLDALWLLLAQSEGKGFKECRKCGKLFAAGPGLRRRHADFGSDGCRIKFNSLQRSR